MLKPSNFLFVCAGNVCRSPAMQGLLEHYLKQKNYVAYVESCGIYSFFLGASPDKRMQKVAQAHSIALENKAKVLEESFFETFDMIFCVTQKVLRGAEAFAPKKELLNKLYIATHFSQKYQSQDIPDPYCGDALGFEKVWEMMEDSCKGIVNHICS